MVGLPLPRGDRVANLSQFGDLLDVGRLGGIPAVLVEPGFGLHRITSHHIDESDSEEMERKLTDRHKRGTRRGAVPSAYDMGAPAHRNGDSGISLLSSLIATPS